jgi:hypothetical protein
MLRCTLAFLLFWVAAPLQPLAFAENGASKRKGQRSCAATFLGGPSGGTKTRKGAPLRARGAAPLSRRNTRDSASARERYLLPRPIRARGRRSRTSARSPATRPSNYPREIADQLDEEDRREMGARIPRSASAGYNPICCDASAS